MKKIISLWILNLFIMSILFTACEGDAGPAGPKGNTGETGATGSVGAKGSTGVKGNKGPSGTNGNTEVLVYSSTAQATLKEGTGKSNYINYTFNPAFISRERAESSAIFLYLKVSPPNAANEEWTAIPGYVFIAGGGSQKFALFTLFGEQTEVRFYRTEGSGSLTWYGAKILFVPSSASARQSSLDYNDYNTVKKYYNLED